MGHGVQHQQRCEQDGAKKDNCDMIVLRLLVRYSRISEARIWMD